MIICFTIQAHFSLDVVTPCTLVRCMKRPTFYLTMHNILCIYLLSRAIYICQSCVSVTIFILIILDLNEIITDGVYAVINSFNFIELYLYGNIRKQNKHRMIAMRFLAL